MEFVTREMAKRLMHGEVIDGWELVLVGARVAENEWEYTLEKTVQLCVLINETQGDAATFDLLRCVQKGYAMTVQTCTGNQEKALKLKKDCLKQRVPYAIGAVFPKEPCQVCEKRAKELDWKKEILAIIEPLAHEVGVVYNSDTITPLQALEIFFEVSLDTLSAPTETIVTGYYDSELMAAIDIELMAAIDSELTRPIELVSSIDPDEAFTDEVRRVIRDTNAMQTDEVKRRMAAKQQKVCAPTQEEIDAFNEQIKEELDD